MLYGSGIVPGTFTATFYDYINDWYDVNLDNQMARKCTVLTQVPATTEAYEANKIDFAGDDVLPKAKKTQALRSPWEAQPATLLSGGGLIASS